MCAALIQCAEPVNCVKCRLRYRSFAVSSLASFLDRVMEYHAPGNSPARRRTASNAANARPLTRAKPDGRYPGSVVFERVQVLPYNPFDEPYVLRCQLVAPFS